MKNMIQRGATLEYTNGTGSAIAAGDPVVVGNQICVAAVDIADGETGICDAEGVFELPMTTGTAIAQGSAPVYDLSAAAFVPEGTTAATGDIEGAVTCWEAAASSATTVKLKINTGIGTVAS